MGSLRLVTIDAWMGYHPLRNNYLNSIHRITNYNLSLFALYLFKMSPMAAFWSAVKPKWSGFELLLWQYFPSCVTTQGWEIFITSLLHICLSPSHWQF